MKFSSKAILKSIYRHIGGNVVEETFLGGKIFKGDKGTVTCLYPTTEVFTSAAAAGVIQTVYK